MKFSIFLRTGIALASLVASPLVRADSFSAAIVKIVAPRVAPGYPGHTALGEKCSVAVYQDAAGEQSPASVWIYSVDARGASHQAEVYIPFSSGNPNFQYVIDRSNIDIAHGDLEITGHFDRALSEAGAERIDLKLSIQGSKTFMVSDEFGSENCTIE